MLIRPADRSLDAQEWQDFVAEHDFGQLIVPTVDGLPIVVPTHFVLENAATILLHLAHDNPALRAIGAGRRVLFTVIGAYTFIPTTWNANPGADVAYGVPTSYYASVQITAQASVTDDPKVLARILTLQLDHFQPEGGHAPVEPGDDPYGKQLAVIRGVVLAIESVSAKFKFGGNKTPGHRLAIADHLLERGTGNDLEARGHQLRRLREQQEPFGQ